jgi:hypothetical protein
MTKAKEELTTVTLAVAYDGKLCFEIECYPTDEAAKFLKMREGAIDEFMKDQGYMVYNDPFTEHKLYRIKDLEKIKRKLSKAKRAKFISM